LPEVPEVKLSPSKIVCVGLNYKDHAAELKMPLPAEPVLFLKPPSALVYSGEDIIYPPQTTELHFEAELAVVIKDRCRNLSVEEAARHILGFTCGNDITARDLQRRDGQWTRAKSFDTFCALGPRIVRDVDPDNLQVKLLLNGRVKQDSSTANMIFSVDQLVSFISQVMTLEPEDVILTGTPPGVGPMERGDTVVVEIAGIGRLENKVR
jgi:2-keto-4-pentenoate hydratase/2-oxohepta-3-ene-1,7-dioic acid hydratase in catechol pathway